MQKSSNIGASRHEGFDEGYEVLKNEEQNLHAQNAQKDCIYEGHEGYPYPISETLGLGDFDPLDIRYIKRPTSAAARLVEANTGKKEVVCRR